MRVALALIFGAVGFLLGVIMQAPLGGTEFTDWRGPFASLAMAGFGAGTGVGLGRGEQAFRGGIGGAVVGALAGALLGLAGAGIVFSALTAFVLTNSLALSDFGHS